jgi:hypothetical protein
MNIWAGATAVKPDLSLEQARTLYSEWAYKKATNIQ